MEGDGLPPAAFASPHGENRAEVEALVRDYASLVVDFLCGAASRPPMPWGITVDQVKELPADPVPEPVIRERLSGVLEGGMNPGNPGYIGHMDPVPALITVLGEFAAAAANNNMLSRELSPELTAIERDLTTLIARRFGLGDGSGGVLTSGGSLANLHTLAVARNRAFDVHRRGLVGLPGRPLIFASEAAHTSLQKAAMLLGLGAEAVIPVPTDAGVRMIPEALDAAILRAREEGCLPFAVVATAGTTVTGSIDPLRHIAEVAHRHELWYHVDAAYGGALIFSPEHRHRLTGIAAADSITFNPQKWLYVAKTCAMALFRERSVLEDHFLVDAPYMRTDAAARFVNLGERSVQGTRHADILKLWLAFQHFGTSGFACLIAESYERTEQFVARLRERPDFELATEPETNVICFRHTRPGFTEGELDGWNFGLQRYLYDEHQVFVSVPQFRGSRWLRAVLLNRFAGDMGIERLLAGVDAYGAEDEFLRRLHRS